ncbi:hypothetical protein N2152v2_005673 [Parachlorella kessleri]
MAPDKSNSCAAASSSAAGAVTGPALGPSGVGFNRWMRERRAQGDTLPLTCYLVFLCSVLLQQGRTLPTPYLLYYIGMTAMVITLLAWRLSGAPSYPQWRDWVHGAIRVDVFFNPAQLYLMQRSWAADASPNRLAALPQIILNSGTVQLFVHSFMHCISLPCQLLLQTLCTDEVLEQLKLKGTKGVLLRNYLGLLRQLQETKELELEAKDRELEAISAVKDRDLLAKEFELQRVTANLLLLRGKLHARGLIEYAEEQLRLRYNLPRLSRVDLWSKISENASGDAEVEELVACISASSGWPRTVIAKEVAHLYKQLSGDIHDVGLYQQSAMAVDLAVPPLQPKQAGLLQCIARITGVAVNIVYYTPAGEDGA